MKKNYKIIYIFILILVIIFFYTTAYSAIYSTMKVTGIAYARVEADVRITDFKLANANNAISSYEEFSKDQIVTDVNLLDRTSSITYYLEITNYGTTDVVIYDITGLPDGVNYSIKDYNLKDKICDDSGKCNSFITKSYEITFTTDFIYSGIISLNFEFRNIYTITYTGIDGFYPDSIISGETLNVVFDSPPKFINVFEDGVERDRSTYTYSNGNLVIDNFNGNLVIEKGESYLITGDEFSRQLKNFVNGTDDATYKSEDYNIKYIGFYEDELPEGITKKQLESLPFIYVSEDNNVKAYNDNGMIYVYSKHDIKPNRSMYSMFREMKNLEKIDLENLETDHVTSLMSTFNGSSSLKELDIAHFITNKVTCFSCTFKNLPLITNLDLSNWDTSSASRLDQMFMGNTGLVMLDLRSFNTSKVDGIWSMFDGMSNIEKIYVGDGWDMSKVTSSSNMFLGCSKLTNFIENRVDVSNAYVGFGGYLSSSEFVDEFEILINRLGGEICIGDECFYLIENDGSVLTLLAKYNLYVGGDYDDSIGTWISYGDKATGKQDSSMLAYKKLSGDVRNGTLKFSSTNYWSGSIDSYPSYVYNSNSNLYSYIENYKSYLETNNVLINTARLLSYDELVGLGFNYSSGWSNVPTWIYSSSYWLGSALSDENLYAISMYPGLSERSYSYDHSYGLRPVIEVSIEEVRKLY